MHGKRWFNFKHYASRRLFQNAARIQNFQASEHSIRTIISKYFFGKLLRFCCSRLKVMEFKI